MSGASALALMDLVVGRAAAQCREGALLELGAYKGRSAALLAHHAGPERPLHIVEQTDHLQLDALREITSDVVGHRMRSEVFCSDELSAALQGRGLVASHHDASHFFESLVLELQAVAPRVHQGGVIILGNFNDLWSQVRAAYYYLRYAAGLPFEALLFGFNKCVLVHQSHFPRWEKFVLHDLLWELRRYRIEGTLARTDNHPHARAFHLKLRGSPDEETLYGVKFWGDRFYRPTSSGAAAAPAGAVQTSAARPRDRGDLEPAWFDGSDAGAAWRLLRAGPVHLHVVGGTPRPGADDWTQRFADLVRRHTGHAHRLTTTAMAGAGLLYGLACFRPNPDESASSIVIIEIGADDVSGGEASIDRLAGWLASMLAALRSAGTPVLVVHGPCRPGEAAGCAEGFASFDRVAGALGIPVVHHDMMLAHRPDPGRPASGAWGLEADTPPAEDAQACAVHLLTCMETMTRHAATPTAAVRHQPSSPPALDELPELVDLAGALAHLPGLIREPFVYGLTELRFDAVAVPAGCRLVLRLSGQLLAIAYVATRDGASPRVRVNDEAEFVTADRGVAGAEARYRLLPLFIDCKGAAVHIGATEPDASSEPDHPSASGNTAPLRLLHVIGTRLRVEAATAEFAP